MTSHTLRAPRRPGLILAAALAAALLSLAGCGKEDAKPAAATVADPALVTPQPALLQSLKVAAAEPTQVAERAHLLALRLNQPVTDLDVVVGNIATGEAAKMLAEAGAEISDELTSEALIASDETIDFATLPEAEAEPLIEAVSEPQSEVAEPLEAPVEPPPVTLYDRMPTGTR